MTRSEFYAAYREARKINAFMNAFRRQLDGLPFFSLAIAVDYRAFAASCRYGDRLKHPAFKLTNGHYRSRVR